MYNLSYCGYNTLNKKNFEIYRKKGSKTYLLVLFIDSMKVYFSDGSNIVTNKSSCILYPPKCFQHYHATDKFFNSYIHFYSDVDIFAKYKIPYNKILYPDNFDEINILFKDLTREFYLKDYYYKDKLISLINIILISISRGLNKLNYSEMFLNRDLKEDFNKARLIIIENCGEYWNIKKMCKLVNLSRSQFYYYYKLFYNCSPKEDLINARLDKAKYLLTNEKIKILKISDICGFGNVYHFTRYFKKKCGCTPGSFRKLKYKQ